MWSTSACARVALVLGATALATACVQWEVASHALTHHETDRFYRTYIPEQLRGKPGPFPLVLVLHGAGGFPDIIDHSHMNEVAARHGFVAVYLSAVGDLWNDGVIRLLGPNRGADVSYLRGVVRDVDAKVVKIDRRRVYAIGFSNGATMAMRLGCEAADMFAGIAAVSGAMPEAIAPTCNPSRPLPILLMNGTEDPIMPYMGGAVRFLGVLRFGRILSTAATAALWARKNGCGPAAPERALPDHDPRDGTRAYQIDFTGCGGAPVRVLRLEGAGHPWPNGLQYLPAPMIGRATRDVDGGEAMWAYFGSVPPR